MAMASPMWIRPSHEGAMVVPSITTRASGAGNGYMNQFPMGEKQFPDARALQVWAVALGHTGAGKPYMNENTGDFNDWQNIRQRSPSVGFAGAPSPIRGLPLTRAPPGLNDMRPPLPPGLEFMKSPTGSIGCHNQQWQTSLPPGTCHMSQYNANLRQFNEEEEYTSTTPESSITPRSSGSIGHASDASTASVAGTDRGIPHDKRAPVPDPVSMPLPRWAAKACSDTRTTVMLQRIPYEMTAEARSR
mmetsp:Transcript_108284/g.311975  ORF Transcript_108284/g.311975 Transcript_108284/m.311975 type:complete len:246 (-) Transcript_108284:142-879(-)